MITANPQANNENNHNRSSNSIMKTPLGSFEVGKTLGEGSYGKVKLITNIETKEKMAVKIIKRYSSSDKTQKSTRTGKGFEQRVLREANLTKYLNHPNIVPLIDCRITKSHFYLFHEFIMGTQLTDKIGHNGLSESKTKEYFKQIVDGISYCHDNFVVHRDIKVENIMVDSNNKIKIIDFGLANFFDQSKVLKTFCGSLQYSAPEIMQGTPYLGPEVDIWSIGVVLFAMLTGQLPFDDPRNPKAWERIMNGRIRFPNHLSINAKDLINKCLNFNPRNRIVMEDIKNHVFIKDYYESDKGALENDAFLNSKHRLMPKVLDMKVVGEMTSCLFKSENEIRTILQQEILNGTEIVDNYNTVKVRNSPCVAIYHLIARYRNIPIIPIKSEERTHLGLTQEGNEIKPPITKQQPRNSESKNEMNKDEENLNKKPSEEGDSRNGIKLSNPDSETNNSYLARRMMMYETLKKTKLSEYNKAENNSKNLGPLMKQSPLLKQNNVNNTTGTEKYIGYHRSPSQPAQKVNTETVQMNRNAETNFGDKTNTHYYATLKRIKEKLQFKTNNQEKNIETSKNCEVLNVKNGIRELPLTECLNSNPIKITNMQVDDLIEKMIKIFNFTLNNANFEWTYLPNKFIFQLELLTVQLLDDGIENINESKDLEKIKVKIEVVKVKNTRSCCLLLNGFDDPKNIDLSKGTMSEKIRLFFQCLM